LSTTGGIRYTFFEIFFKKPQKRRQKTVTQGGISGLILMESG